MCALPKIFRPVTRKALIFLIWPKYIQSRRFSVTVESYCDRRDRNTVYNLYDHDICGMICTTVLGCAVVIKANIYILNPSVSFSFTKPWNQTQGKDILCKIEISVCPKGRTQRYMKPTCMHFVF